MGMRGFRQSIEEAKRLKKQFLDLSTKTSRSYKKYQKAHKELEMSYQAVLKGGSFKHLQESTDLEAIKVWFERLGDTISDLINRPSLPKYLDKSCYADYIESVKTIFQSIEERYRSFQGQKQTIEAQLVRLEGDATQAYNGYLTEKVKKQRANASGLKTVQIVKQ